MRPVCDEDKDIYNFPKFYSGITKTRLKNISINTETIQIQCVLLHLRYVVADHFENDVRFACAYPTQVAPQLRFEPRNSSVRRNIATTVTSIFRAKNKVDC